MPLHYIVSLFNKVTVCLWKVRTGCYTVYVKSVPTISSVVIIFTRDVKEPARICIRRMRIWCAIKISISYYSYCDSTYR